MYSNNRYYSQEWINEVPGHASPNDDSEVIEMRNMCYQKLFPDHDDFKTIEKVFVDFVLYTNALQNQDSIEDKLYFEPEQWWGTHGVSTELLEKISFEVT